MKRVM